MTAGRDCRKLFFAAVLLMLLPLAFVQYVPMVDLPGHLARIYILRNYQQVPQFRQIYELAPDVVPNLALEMVILPLTFVMSLWHAARVFVAAGMLVFALGCWMLSKAVYGRITPLAVLALFTQYNSTFFYGFVAFQFSVGLAFMTLALWYRWRARWSVARVLAVSALGVVIYLCHLGGFMYLGIGIGSLTLWTCLKERRVRMTAITAMLPLALPVAIQLSLHKAPGSGGAPPLAFGTWAMKLRHAGVLLIGYNAYADVAVAVVLALALAAALLYGKARFHAEPGVAGIVFAILFLLTPAVFLSGTDADTRLVMGAGVFLLMGFTWEISATRGRWIYAVALLALATRVSYCGLVWKQQSDFIAGHVAFLDAIPEGARVYPLKQFPQDPAANKFERVLTHVPDLATITRRAIVPTTFTIPGQHPLVQRTPLWFDTNIDPAHPESFDWNRVAQEYDVIWQYGADPALRAVLAARFHPAGQYGDARLYRTGR